MDRPSKAPGLRVVWGNLAEDGDSLPLRAADSHSHTNRLSAVSQYLLLPLVILFGLTWVFRVTDLDLIACRLFSMEQAPYFPYLNANPWLFLYHFGTIPGLAMGFGGAAIAVLGCCSILIGSGHRLRVYRRPCLFAVLLLALGPGLIVNGLLKPLSERPRPCQLVEFGGDEPFVRVLSTYAHGKETSKSFPSGHASMGFFLLAPAFLLYSRNRRWSMMFLVLGLAMGGMMGLARVVQGRHFPSDVLWAAASVYFPGLILCYMFHFTDRMLAKRRAKQNEPAAVHSIEAARNQPMTSEAPPAETTREAERRAA